MFKAFFARLPDKIASTPIIFASVTITRMVGHLISEDLVQVTLLLNIEQDDDKKKKNILHLKHTIIVIIKKVRHDNNIQAGSIHHSHQVPAGHINTVGASSGPTHDQPVTAELCSAAATESTVTAWFSSS